MSETGHDDDDDDDIDVCLGCGTYYGPHRALKAWDRDAGIAPQLCLRCWRAQGYPVPELQ